jgi:hypothetical protein
MKVRITGAGDGGTTVANQIHRLAGEAQIAVPLHRLIDRLESGGG